VCCILQESASFEVVKVRVAVRDGALYTLSGRSLGISLADR
jgi:hypothetical protein